MLLRTRKLAEAGHPLEKAEALEHAFGRVQARLKWTPEKFDRAHEQVRRGEFIPLQELRNERTRRLRPDARSQWRELAPLLQELVPDEMEGLAANPPRGEFFNFDIAHAGEGGVDYVFLKRPLIAGE